MTNREEEIGGALRDLLTSARSLGASRITIDAVPAASTIGVLARAFDELRRRSVRLPRRLVFTALEDDRIVATYQDAGDRLTVNTASRFWIEPGRSMQAEHATGFLVSDDPCAIVYHEIGHALHRRRYRFGRHWWSHSSRPLAERERTIARRVSRYAMEDTGEFVAEVFAGALCGRPFDDEVLRLYEDLKGPRL